MAVGMTKEDLTGQPLKLETRPETAEILILSWFLSLILD